MTLLDRLLGHDAWTTRQMLLLCRDLPNAQLDATFDMSHGTVRKTFLHILRNMEAWTDVMSGRPIRPKHDDDADQRSVPGMIKRLDEAARDFAQVAKAVEARGGWDEIWIDPTDPAEPEKTYGGTIGHLLTHSMHHRGQLIFMLRKLGVPELPEGDLLFWELQLGKAR
jgi:uncharacterized damage-inducible protein DinB